LCNKPQKYIHFPALPFSQRVQVIKKPPLSGFPWQPKSLGEEILRRRLELGLTQEEAGEQLGLNHQTFSRWETGENIPNVTHYPKIIAFLGYYPFKTDDTFGGKIKQYRFIHGLSLKKLAPLLKLPVKMLQEIEENGVMVPTGAKEKFISLFKAKTI
jgi:transcriptional regulator with XRE-family HTH domain